MPTTSGGLNFSYPNSGDRGWNSTLVTLFNTLSAHNHTGTGDGNQLNTSSFVDNSVTDLKVRLRNNQSLRARNAANSADVNILKVDASDRIVFNSGFIVGGSCLDSSGNELISFTSTASAVNEVTVTNAATTGNPTISATGGDTSINLSLQSKGTDGQIVLDHWKLPKTDGSNGQFLRTDGSGNLSFHTGAVIMQVVSSMKISGSATNSSTYADVTSASLSITPSHANNKILVIFNWNCDVDNVSAVNTTTYWRFFRDATQLDTTDKVKASGQSSGGGDQYDAQQAWIYIDSPSTTSSVTYKMQHRIVTSSTTMNVSSTEINIILAEIYVP